MSLVIVGTNHKYSPIKLREKISFSKKRLKQSIFFLKETNSLKGAVILSTCNRVEIYASTDDLKNGAEEIKYFISRYHEIAMQNFSPYLYIYEGKEAMRHLISVTSGLDSLILGETQILGQVRFSFQEAERANFVDGFLRKAFSGAIFVAKKVHTQTLLSEGKISMGSVAVDFVKEKLGTLHKKNILIIGVGKVTELVLRYLKKEASSVVFISNRTFEKAKELAERIGACAVRFDNLKEFLKHADIIITATASPHFIIKKETLRNVISRKLVILDLAVPRDVDPEVKEIKDIELFNLEDLGSTIQKNLERRKIEAEKAKSIIDQEVERIWERLTESVPERACLP